MQLPVSAVRTSDMTDELLAHTKITNKKKLIAIGMDVMKKLIIIEILL